MDLQLRDKVVVVTGASRGIGLAVTRAFAAEGARVVAVARDPGQALADLAAGHPVVPVAADLSGAAGVESTMATAVDRFGAIDVLVNNVGTAALRPGGALSVTDEEWLATFNLNLLGAVRACRAAIGPLVAARGTIVNVSSIHAAVPDPGLVDYGASKAALTSFAKALAKEVSPQGVRVNTVSFGPVRTDLMLAQLDTLAKAASVTPEAAIEMYAAGLGGLPTGRLTTLDEAADVVLMLASGRVGNLTGANLTVDGGLVKAA